MFQENELVNLVMGLFSFILFLIKRKQFPEYNLFFIAYYLILGALIFTVVEGVIFCDFFNFLEHLSYALAGILFAFGSYKYFIKPGDTAENRG